MKVLIIPGGGAFGVIPSRLLAECDGGMRQVDVFGGTSVGGLLAMFYASGMHPIHVHALFRDLLADVFRSPWWSRMVPGPRYDGATLERALRSHLPGNLGDLQAKVVIPSIDYTANKPKIWDNLTAAGDLAAPLWQVGRATSAAPIYFPSQGVATGCREHAHIDGGLLENIPIVTTCVAIKRKLGVPFEEMDVLVVATGHQEVDEAGRAQAKVRKWGLLNWGRPMVGMLTGGNEMGSMVWGRAIGLGALTMFDPVVLPHGCAMDDVALARKLEAVAGDHAGRFRTMFHAWLAR